MTDITSDPDLNTNEADQRPTRSRWSKDRDTRLKAMAKAMPEFIQPYYGNEVVISAAMSVPLADVQVVIQANPELVEMKEIAVNSREALLVDRAMYLAETSRTFAPVKFMLEQINPGKYAKKTGPAPKNGKGFTAPTPNPSEMPSVLGNTGTNSSKENE